VAAKFYVRAPRVIRASLACRAMGSDHRHPLGALGERIAAAHLTGRGFDIVDRNFRTRYGELDLVASGAGCLVFCEVKARIARGPPGPFGPLAAVGPAKRRQVRRMAGRWLAERAAQPRERPSVLRFDAIGVTLSPEGELVELEHVEDAF
jgi:putative endonuclease